MVTIKHKVTLKTKNSQEEVPAESGKPVVTLKRKQPEAAPVEEKPTVTLKKKQPEVAPVTKPEVKPEPAKVTPPTPKPEKKSNTGKIIGGIAAVVTILAGVYFFGMKGDDNVAQYGSAPTEQIAQAGNTDQQADITEGAILGEEVASNNDSEVAVLVETNEAHVSVGTSNAATPAKAESKETEEPSTNESLVIKPTQPSQPKQNKASATNMASASSPISDDVVENAKRVIRGDFGNGKERKDKLGSAYTEIQSKVNEMYRQGLVH